MRRHTASSFAVGFGCLISAAMASGLLAADTPVKTDTGMVAGSRLGTDSKVRAFKGIPFAAPPVGKLRWQPPQPAEPWQGVRECTQFSAICPQAPYPAGSVYAQAPQPQSEDCLYLNVWTTADRETAKQPVMVWIHGGALTRGSSSIASYDGEALARQGVVLVSINYRLGPFGYLAYPALSRESKHNSSGNYGVLDQIAALQWVQRNIGAYGGDPNRVTIFGESAGSWSVCSLLATPLTKGLFQRAIGESGGCFSPMQFLREERNGLQPAEKTGESFAVALGCDKASDPLAAMRQKSTEEILAVAVNNPGQARARANVDGWIFPQEILQIFAEGKQQPVPVIVGSNADEGTSLAGGFVPASRDGFLSSVKSKYGDLTDRFLQVYPMTSDSDVRNAFLHSLRDEIFTWEMRTWARLTEKANAKAYLYYFTRVPPRPDQEKYGAYHAAEIPYVFNNLAKTPWPNQPTDVALAEAMSNCWVCFAATGDPNGPSTPAWAAYNQQQEPYLEFGETIKPGKALLKPECDFYDAYFAAKRGQGSR